MSSIDVAGLEKERDRLAAELRERQTKLEEMRARPTEDPSWEQMLEQESKAIYDLEQQLSGVDAQLQNAQPAPADTPEQFVVEPPPLRAPGGKASLKGRGAEILFGEQPADLRWQQYQDAADRAGRWDPVIPGVSFGSGTVRPATITSLVTDNQTGQVLLLLQGFGRLKPGDAILQPAASDPPDVIAEVTRAVFGECCDVAVARPVGGRELLSVLPDGGLVSGTAEPTLGMRVKKYGQTTGLTYGYVTLIDLMVRVAYGGQVGEHQFSGMFATAADLAQEQGVQGTALAEGEPAATLKSATSTREANMSEMGDMGALVLDEENRAVGVIVARSETMTVCMPISAVLRELNVSLVTEPVRVTWRERAGDGLAAVNDLVVDVPDKLNFSDYVDAFVRLVYDPATKPPLAIGIYGAWGVGKSFLMTKIAEALKKQMQAEIASLPWWRRPFRLTSTDVPIISFNAWAYSASEKLWAGLVQEIFRGLERSGLGWWGEMRLNLQRNLEREWAAFKAKLLPFTLIAAVIAALALVFVATNRAELAVAILTPAGLAVLLGGLKELIALVNTPASERIVQLFDRPDYSSELGFMWRIRDDLQRLADSLPAEMKVIVFIDDLDRCDPEKAVEVLEAVKLLLDLDRFIVFLGLDTRVITEAVEQHYGKVFQEAGLTGYEYLDKIVQIPFSIPTPNPDEISDYLGYLMGMEETVVKEVRGRVARPAVVLEPIPAAAPAGAQPAAGGPLSGITPLDESLVGGEFVQGPPPPSQEQEFKTLYAEKITPFTEKEQEAFLTFADYLVANPRRLKRLVNVYRLSRALAARRGVNLIHDQPQDVLFWLTLCEQWPYATHLMLQALDKELGTAGTLTGRQSLLQQAMPTLHQQVKDPLSKNGDPELVKLDMDYGELEQFVSSFGQTLTLGEIQRLRPFTINFNPALTAEVQRSLSNPKKP